MKVKGHPSSVGYVAWAERKEDEDSVITALLRQAGAVLYVKTNVPTSLMHGDTYNNASNLLRARRCEDIERLMDLRWRKRSGDIHAHH